MRLPATLDVALKEWAAVCSALLRARQILLLRKGGIHEIGGQFDLEHPHFLLFPTYLHQNQSMLKESEHAGLVPMTAEPEHVSVTAAAAVSDIIQINSRAQVDAIDDQHVWTRPLIDMRFNYRPENPLYLLLVRVYRLPEPVSIINTPAYAGCKSWVPLEQKVDTSGAHPVLDDQAYESRRALIRNRVSSPE